MRGKVVMLNFWATLLRHLCRRDARDGRKRIKQYHQQGLEFFAVAMRL